MDQKPLNLCPETIAENQAAFKEAFESPTTEDAVPRHFKMDDNHPHAEILTPDPTLAEDDGRIAHVDQTQRSSAAVLSQKHLSGAALERVQEEIRRRRDELPADIQEQAELLTNTIANAPSQSELYRDMLESGHVDAVAQISRNEVGLAVTILRHLIMRMRDDVHEVHAKAEGLCSTGDILALYLRELMEFKGKVDAGKETSDEENKRAYFILAVIAFFKRNYDFLTSPANRQPNMTTASRRVSRQAARR